MKQNDELVRARKGGEEGGAQAKQNDNRNSNV